LAGILVTGVSCALPGRAGVAQTAGGAGAPPAAQQEVRPASPAEVRPAPAPGIAVEGPWARAAGATANTAAYLVLRNRGPAGDALIAARSGAADAVELHRSSMDGGVMRMRPVERIDVPAQGQMALEPGGLHVMLIGLRQDLPAGASLTVTLVFEQAGEVDVAVPVRAAG
jgi:copper(I)-binding protein